MENKKFKWWHIVVITFSVVFGLCFAALHAPSWDEMHYVDPGAQLALQGRMVSNVWVSNSPSELWASSNPGLPLLFSGWFKIFGFGIIQSRALFFILHISGVYLFYLWVKNKFNPPAWALVIGISGSFILPSLAEPIIGLRLEVLAYLFFSLFLFYTWTDKKNIFLNWIAPIFLGLLTVLFGFHFTLFYLLAAGIAILLKRDRVTFIRAISMVVGIIFGVIILWQVYIRLDMWHTFITARGSHIGKQLPWCPIGWKKFTVVEDWSTLLLLSLVGLAANFRQSIARWLPWALATAAFFVIPYIISLMGIYYRSYIWMVSLPVITCFYHRIHFHKKWSLNFSIIIILITFIIIGRKNINYAKNLYSNWKHRSRVLQLVKDKIPRESSIVANSHFYYYVTGNGCKFYPRGESTSGESLGYKQDYFFPKNLRDQVNFMFFSSDYGDISTKTVSDMGGEWILIGDYVAPGKGRPFEDISIFIRK